MNTGDFINSTIWSCLLALLSCLFHLLLASFIIYQAVTSENWMVYSTTVENPRRICV